MNLHIIASGCPAPLPHWYGSSFVLEVEGTLIMLDCGPAATQKLVQTGLRPTQIHHLFLTHHHFDHNADFPCFALTRWDLSTEDIPLNVYGPAPTERFVQQLLGEKGAFSPDWQSRIDHPTSRAIHKRRGGGLPRPAPTTEARNLSSGDTVSCDDGWTVEARTVSHVEPGLTSMAYLVQAQEGSILFAGDCADCDALRSIAKQADTLVLACAIRGRDQRHDVIRDVITGSTDAGKIAAAADVDRLVLTHPSPDIARPGWREGAVADAARLCQADIFFPEETTTIPL